MSKQIKAIEINNFSFRYAVGMDNALNDINFSADHGEFITLCGKSGSGKSTLMRNLKTVLAPAGKKSGEIMLYGRSIDNVSDEEQAARVGFVMQDSENQIVTDKVWHEMAFGMENLGYDTDTIRLRVAEMASFFGIENWFDMNVNDLSGGQKQLLNLASVMAVTPDILVLDEPTSALDPMASEEFIMTLRRINREIGTTVLISEHNLNEVMPLSDRVVILDKGHIIIDTEPDLVGTELLDTDSELISSMPVPLQVYLGVNAVNEIKDISSGGNTDYYGARGPITVRDGRAWLSQIFSEKEISSDSIEPPAVKSVSGSSFKLTDVRFKYKKDGKDILENLDLEIDEGVITTIVGGNGAGKSTLLKVMTGILSPYKGKVRHDNKRIVLLPQNPQTLFVEDTVDKDMMDVIKNSDMIRKLGLTEEEKLNKKNKILKLMGLDELRARHPYDLSGGEQQRAALAKVLLTESDTLLLDEPTTGLDSLNKKLLGGILKKLASEGKTIIMVTHDLEFAASYSDTCRLLFKGQIMASGEPRSFFSWNNFYTTAGNRMSRHLFRNAVTVEDVIELCRINLLSKR